MSRSILSPKLEELEKKRTQMTSALHRLDRMDAEAIEREQKAALERCTEEWRQLEREMQQSRSPVVQQLCRYCEQLKETSRDGRKALARQLQGLPEDDRVDETILLAEYALDFAGQAADWAQAMVLYAMRAEDARKE